MEYTEKEKKAITILDEFELRRKTVNYNRITVEDSQCAKTVLNLLEKQQKEIERLDKDNNELKRIYKNTAEHLAKIGNTELSNYFYAQIDLVPTFYVGDIIDYYEEYYKQKKIIKELELEIKDLKNKTQIISPLYVKENYIFKDKIRKNIKELNDNRPYLSKFDDWKEKEYTNEDVTNKCVEVLEDLLGGE